MNQLQAQIGQAGNLGMSGIQDPQAPDFNAMLQQLMDQFGQGQQQAIPAGAPAVNGFSPATAGKVTSALPKTAAPRSAPRSAAPAKSAAPTRSAPTRSAPTRTPTPSRAANPVAKFTAPRPGPQAGAKATPARRK